MKGRYLFYSGVVDLQFASLESQMFPTKVVQKIKTHVLCSVTFFSEKRAVYEIMWKNIVEPGRPHMTWRMRIA